MAGWQESKAKAFYARNGTNAAPNSLDASSCYMQLTFFNVMHIISKTRAIIH